MPRIDEDNNVVYQPLTATAAPKPTAAQSFTDYAKTRQAELDALSAKVAANAATTTKQLQDLNTPTQEPIDPLKDKSNPPSAPAGYEYKWIGGTTTGSWKLYKLPSAPTGGSGGVISSTPVTATNSAEIAALQAKIAALEAANTKAAADAAALAQEKAMQREAAGKIVADRFAQYGLGTLANKIMELARAGYSEATITLELQNTDEYKMRFAGNQDRIKKGLAVLTPAEYISSEDAYRQTLRAYGLTQFDNDQYVRQFIANDVSPQELSSRVSIAVQRVQNADPTITKTLRDFYGIGTTDMVAYILDPNQALPKIQQQVAAAEIGSAARMQGLEAGVSVSEQLARQGISQAEAQKGYATIADILPSAEKLSAIYGATLDTYGQGEAEQEVFNSLASAQRKRRALSARETATFSGSAGTGRGSLGSSATGAF